MNQITNKSVRVPESTGRMNLQFWLWKWDRERERGGEVVTQTGGLVFVLGKGGSAVRWCAAEKRLHKNL